MFESIDRPDAAQPAKTVPPTHSAPPRPIADLGDEIAEVAGHLWAGMARFLELLGEFDRREGWSASGIDSCGKWLAWRCGMSARTARDYVRVAHALQGLPLIAETFSRGTLSYSKVRAISRIATPATEPVLVEWAHMATTWQLEHIVRGVRMAKAFKDPSLMQRRRSLTVHHDEDGLVTITLRLPPEAAAIVLRAIESILHQMEQEDGSPEPQTADHGPSDHGPSDQDSPRGSGEPHHEPPTDALLDDPDDDPYDFDAAPRPQRRRADAFVRLAENHLRADPPSKRARSDDAPDALIVIHTDDGFRYPRLDSGTPIPETTLYRLACESAIIRINPDMSIGRQSRTPTRRMSRALRRRDRTCRFPGCGRRKVHAHHIVFWIPDGETSLHNLVLLCPRHHSAIHDHGYSVVRKDDGTFTFRRPDGTIIESPAKPTTFTALAHRNRQAGLAVTPQTCATDWDGVAPDYGLSVGVLLDREHRADNPSP